MTVVPYLPLPAEIIRRIVAMQLDRIARRVHEAYRARFEYDDAVVAQIAARCTESASGARNVESILSRTLLPELSARVLARLGEGAPLDMVAVAVDSAGDFEYRLS